MSGALLLHERPQGLCNLRGRHYAGLPPHWLPLMKQYQRWNTLHPVLLGDGLVAVHVNFDDAQLTAVLGRYLLQNGGLCFAGSTPSSVKIDQHGHAGAVDEFGKGLTRHGRELKKCEN